MSHTPGPWDIYTGSEDKNVIAVSHWKQTERGGHIGLCVAKMPIPTDNVSQEAINANAKLIAVAPQLLDIVKRLGVYLPDDLQTEVNAVIEKATS